MRAARPVVVSVAASTPDQTPVGGSRATASAVRAARPGERRMGPGRGRVHLAEAAARGEHATAGHHPDDEPGEDEVCRGDQRRAEPPRARRAPKAHETSPTAKARTRWRPPGTPAVAAPARAGRGSRTLGVRPRRAAPPQRGTVRQPGPT